jgi:hypothetical protein
MTCFYCSNQINPTNQRYISARIAHRYKHGGIRFSNRNFHIACFTTFSFRNRCPFNPHTRYVPLHWVLNLPNGVVKCMAVDGVEDEKWVKT